MKHKRAVLHFVCVLFTLLVTTVTLAAPDGLSPVQTKQVESLIKTYFVKHPQDLLEAFHALQSFQQAKEQKEATQNIVKNANAIFSSPSSPVIGNPKGNVSLVEFLDYQCAHCREMLTVIQDQKASDKQLRVVIKQLPIFGGRSVYAAKAALAAYRQPQFEAFHAALLTTKKPLTEKHIIQLARKAKLNIRKLKKDMKDKAIMEEIEANVKLARSIGLKGTPAIIIGKSNGQFVTFIPGATSQPVLQKAIADARKGASRTVSPLSVKKGG